MSVYQGTDSGVTTEQMNLDMEQMSDQERRDYLTGILGSSAAADAYLRASVGEDPNVSSEEIGNIDQTSKIYGCNEFSENTPVSTRISKYYSLAMLSSATAYTKYQIVPHQGLSKSQIMCNLKHLAMNSLDPIRDWNTSVKIGSGFRSNSSTDHGAGSAADLYFYKAGTTTRMSISELVVVAKALIYTIKIPFTQMLVESSGNGSGTGWIHVSNRRSGINSGMRVGYSLNNGGTYHAGLPNI